MRNGCALLFCLALLSACGGGGSGGGGATPPGPTPTPTQTPTPVQTPTNPPSTTNASGSVVDDGTGAALPGVKVVLEPWIAGATPIPSPQTTTAADGSFVLSGAPNGHYLLVIGNDTPGQTSTAVVHDNVTLTGGNQTLTAPTLPSPIPGYTAPPWETNGKYRIATLDPTTDVPCFTGWNADRAAHALPAAVPDEWLQESVRAQTAYVINGHGGTVPANGGLLSVYNIQAGSTGINVPCGTDEADVIFAGTLSASEQAAALSSHVLWYGGTWVHYTFNATPQYSGYAELPYDPRYQVDPVGNWP